MLSQKKIIAILRVWVRAKVKRPKIGTVVLAIRKKGGVQNMSDGKCKMVGWYAPSQPLNSAEKKAILTAVGEFVDPRLGTADPKPGRFLIIQKN